MVQTHRYDKFSARRFQVDNKTNEVAGRRTKRGALWSCVMWLWLSVPALCRHTTLCVWIVMQFQHFYRTVSIQIMVQINVVQIAINRGGHNANGWHDACSTAAHWAVFLGVICLCVVGIFWWANENHIAIKLSMLGLSRSGFFANDHVKAYAICFVAILTQNTACAQF